MNLREKVLSGSYAGVGMISAFLSKLPSQTTHFHELINSYGLDIAIPFTFYFWNIFTGASLSKNKLLNASSILFACYLAEFSQLNSSGTFDLNDIAAYSIGAGLALGLDNLTLGE